MLLTDLTLHDATIGEDPVTRIVTDIFRHAEKVTDLGGTVILTSAVYDVDVFTLPDTSQMPALRCVLDSVVYSNEARPNVYLEGEFELALWFIYEAGQETPFQAQRNRFARHWLRAFSEPDLSVADATASGEVYSQPKANEAAFGYRNRIKYCDFAMSDANQIQHVRYVERAGERKQLSEGVWAMRLPLRVRFMNNAITTETNP